MQANYAKTIGVKVEKITEEELQKRLAAMPPLRVAGPDDPIYSSGLTMYSVPRSKPSTKSSPTSTDGAGASNTALPEAPMGGMSDPKVVSRIQGAVDQAIDEMNHKDGLI